MEPVKGNSVDRPKGAKSAATRELILESARRQLFEHGYARLSTRGVAQSAGVPLSQLHYHFGSKQQLILDLLETEDARRIARQTKMYAEDRPLWQRYEQACDYFEDDLDSGYVRVLQEMIAAGWSDPAIGARVRELLLGWRRLLTEVAREAEQTLGPLGPFTADEFAGLVGQAFLGGEAMLMLGFDRQEWPVRSALRRLGQMIRDFEERGPGAAGTA